MNTKQTLVFTMIVIAGLVNTGADVVDNRDPVTAIVGTFLVLVVLVALASSATVGSIAVAFAAAFLITSAMLNASPILTAFNNLEGVKSNG